MAGDEWAVREPHPELRRHVSRYIGYTQSGNLPSVHRGLPSRHVTVSISLAAPIRVLALPDGTGKPSSLTGLVGGIHVGPALIAQDAFQSGIQLELNPLGTAALLGVSSAELAGDIVDLADFGSPALASLAARLAETPTWRGRFAVLDAVLRAQLAESGGVPAEIEWAWRRLTGAAGALRVADLASEVGWSRRHFGERFRRELGLSPKQASRVLRFERANTLLRGEPTATRGGLAELAVLCGYYDQAHLTNEWQALAGCSPGAWIAEELPFLQAGAEGERSDSFA
ncbi:AraC family transcriptional regulator [Prauserella marina]|uniref:Helix-turn-helix domain-containing protein n=1 Tax=Prauserella marina TaxID=530584 RepID=A0A222VLI4_9PSEU|nr:AraC family transcriptional regulator [Prauserella marina]ASR34786.1 AraC family transcriptional regulator [Prauserella marina]PWV85530.1 AraC family transcriptional regulator [Prauserella marina]SDC52665.1 Helix-turn-helix domain-containing protein [Prauserella marina]